MTRRILAYLDRRELLHEKRTPRIPIAKRAGTVGYRQYGGRRIPKKNLPNTSITIFFISFVYPVRAGYPKRMDLLISWATERFRCVNFVIPREEIVPVDTINAHLEHCDNLFLLDCTPPQFPRFYSAQKLSYKLITGRYPKFFSSLVLNKSLSAGFASVMKENKTDYFVNTRSNFGGLIHFLPAGVKSIFDTQDVFTDMYRTYDICDRSPCLQKLLIGYRETGDFVEAEKEILARYDTIIAIAEPDYQKYRALHPAARNLIKIESVGIPPSKHSTACTRDKEFDLVVVASTFLATQRGIEWFVKDVAPYFTRAITLCVVGSIGEYIRQKQLSNPRLIMELKGLVDTVDQYYEKSRVVPLLMQEGTGTSVKGLEALAFGAAIVSTTAGVRFGGVESGKHCIISNDPKTFAQSIEMLLADEAQRCILGRNALQYARDCLSTETAFKLLDSAL